MKKSLLLTSVLALAACGGGSGSGTITGSNTPGDINTPISIRASNANVSSSFSNEDKRTAVAINNYKAADEDLPEVSDLHTTQNHSNMAPRRVASRNATIAIKNTIAETLIDAMYENMYYWLVKDGGHNPETLAEKIQYKHALILAGFVNLDFNDMQAAISSINNEEAHDQAANIYAELGTLKTFDGTNIEWFSSPDNTGANDKITFNIDSTTKKVTGINYVANTNMPSRERNIDMNRKDDTNVYNASNVHIYQYGLKNIECIGACPNNSNETYDPDANEKGGRNFDISVTKPLTSTEQIKEKLLAEVEIAYQEGFFHNFHNAVQNDERGENGDVNQDLIAQRLKEATIERINNWENETNKINESLNVNIENNLTTYGHLVGLAYSDFGTMNIKMKTSDNNNNISNDTKIVYGGYKDKKIELQDMNTTMRFVGVAKGQVSSKIEENQTGNDISVKPTLALQDDAATLVFVPGQNNQKTETLTASFKDNDWYDVKIIKDSNASGPAITFTDNTTNGIHEDYKFIGHTSGTTYEVPNFTVTDSNFDFNGDTITGSRGGTFDIAYYGDNNIPSEAVGYITYGESEPYRTDPDDWHATEIKNIDFQVGFGMQKDITK